MKKFWMILALLGALLIGLEISSLPASADEDIVYYGSCGDDVTWTLDKEGNLIIEGSGPITFDSIFEVHGKQHLLLSNWIGSPWEKIPDAKILTLEIKEGVTAIPYRAFNGLDNLESVQMADSVTSIGLEAFYSNEALTEVVFSKGLRTIGGSAFAYCESLTEAYFHDGLTTIEGDAFFSCDALSLVRIPASVTEIGTDAFKWCRELTTVMVESPTIAKAATDPGAVGKLFCHPINILVGRSVTVLGAQIKSHHTAEKTVIENGISYTKYTYQPPADAEWYYDEAHHFLLCESGCDVTLVSQAHVLDNACDERCNICDYYAEKSHAESLIYIPVDDGHQTACEYCGEKLSSKVEAHDWGDICRGEECYDCGQTRQAPGHDFSPWQTDAWEHQKECARCHWVERGQHSGDDVCTDCGWIDDGSYDHSFGDVLTYDENFHWWQCTHCEAVIMGMGEHVMDAGVVLTEPTSTKEGEIRYSCTGCNYTVTEPIAPLGGATEPSETEPLPPETQEVPPTEDNEASVTLYLPVQPSPNDEYSAKPQIKIVWSPWALPAIIGGVLLAAAGLIVLLILKKKKKSN